MSVSKRGGNFYHYAFMIDGRRYRGSTKETSLAMAKRFESCMIREIREDRFNLHFRRAPRLSEFAIHFLQYVDDCVGANQLSPNTRRVYKSGWRLLSETRIADWRINKIKTSDAATLKFPCSAWNANMALRALRRILGYACEVRVLQVAPEIRTLKVLGCSMRIRPSVEAKLLEHLPGDAADVFRIILDSGMRPEEVMRMRWENVEWEFSRYFIPHGKTLESRRFVPMADRIVNVLRARQQGSKSPWVFPGNSKAGHRTTVALSFEEARAAAGLDPRIVLYLARHEFATSFLECGGDIGTLQKILGHASITTTQKYLHPDIGLSVDIINRRNRART
jgi:integrase